MDDAKTPDPSKAKMEEKDASKFDLFEDLIIDPSRQNSKKSPFYQTMSPYNILKQNLVFDIPVGLTLE